MSAGFLKIYSLVQLRIFTNKHKFRHKKNLQKTQDYISHVLKGVDHLLKKKKV